MCGIAGVLAFEPGGFTVTESYLRRMRDALSHRGPDGAGLWLAPDGQVGLGHRRLAIIDLSEAARQPMSNEADTLWVVFNGEIYNHAALRAELETQGGHRWKTDHSDSEVILHAFETWGIDCVHRFRGMFALALWDAHAREMWLVRDRLGVKPLYYSLHHGRLTFASEIKALLQDPEQPRAINEEAFYHYLTFLTTPAPETLFRGIRKLPAGCWLRVTADGRIREQRYWDVWDEVSPMTGVPEEEISARLLAELRRSVQLRKVSDVPVGVFLSGGLDSSTNAALFSEGETRRVRTFAIGYEGDYASCRDELHYARRMAELVGAEHHERRLTQRDLIDFLPEMIRLQDEPIADPVCVPVYYLSKLARECGTTVCQVGEGSDELFCGYPLWKLKLKLQRWDNGPVPNGVKRLGLAGLRLLGQAESHPYEALRRGSRDEPVFWSGAEAFTETQKQRLLSPRLRREFAGLTSWEVLRPIRQRFDERAWEPSALHWMSYVDLSLRLPELLLMRVDKMSMGVALEGRVPFLDHQFVALALSIPTAVKTRNGTLKHILKRSVRGLVPDELIDRPKQGFGVPVYEWMRDELGEQARRELDSFCRETDLLDRAAVERILQSGHGPRIWQLLNVALWWKEYVGEPGAGSGRLVREGVV